MFIFGLMARRYWVGLHNTLLRFANGYHGNNCVHSTKHSFMCVAISMKEWKSYVNCIGNAFAQLGTHMNPNSMPKRCPMKSGTENLVGILSLLWPIQRVFSRCNKTKTQHSCKLFHELWVNLTIIAWAHHGIRSGQVSALKFWWPRS